MRDRFGFGDRLTVERWHLHVIALVSLTWGIVIGTLM